MLYLSIALTKKLLARLHILPLLRFFCNMTSPRFPDDNILFYENVLLLGLSYKENGRAKI